MLVGHGALRGQGASPLKKIYLPPLNILIPILKIGHAWGNEGKGCILASLLTFIYLPQLNILILTSSAKPSQSSEGLS